MPATGERRLVPEHLPTLEQQKLLLAVVAKAQIPADGSLCAAKAWIPANGCAGRSNVQHLHSHVESAKSSGGEMHCPGRGSRA